MDPVESNSITGGNNSESSVRPTLSQVKKSWGFRRSTIARREFREEVGDLTHSPPLLRRGRSRRVNQTPEAPSDTCTAQRATQPTRSVIDDLEWSAPSSPVSALEASTAGSLDPSLWQDFGSAFHTAFSLLGGNEGLSADMSDALSAPVLLETTDAVEVLSSQRTDEMEVSNVTESTEDMGILLPVTHTNVEAGGNEDIVIISSQEEDSDEMTLIQIKEQMASKGRERDTRARGVKGGRGRARGKVRGRGRGRAKCKGRGRGKSRAVELLASIADGEESDDDVMLVSPAEPQLEQLQEEEKRNDPHTAAVETAPADCMGPTQPSDTDCIVTANHSDQITDVTPGQYHDASEQEEEMKEEEVEEEKKKNHIKIVREYSSISDTEGYDSDALYCVCRQKHNKRFMICCDTCQEWFHGDCVGVSETRGRKLEKTGQEYICPTCTTKKQLESEPHPQPEPDLGLTPCLSGEEVDGHKDQRALKETVEAEVENEQAPVMKAKPEPEIEMETNNSLPLCIGPGCSKQALPDSGYCGTDCILQHAAVTMKALSGPKVPKSRGQAQKDAATDRPNARVQKTTRTSKRLAGKAKEEGEEKAVREDGGDRADAETSLACDPSLTEVQAPCIPSSQFYTVSKLDGGKDVEAVTPLTQSPGDSPTDAAPAPTQRDSQEKAREAEIGSESKQQAADSDPSTPPGPAEPVPPSAAQSSSNSSPRHHETGALVVTKTTYVIPKKQAGAPSPSASCQKPPSGPALLSETRNLPVPPAPSAPSSRPSQPNTQIRQSIQRSLTSILLKRLCDCEDLKMSESDVTKLVANIEMEMFDIFRNTDSKYMNKYRTIMFNVKDPRNKGLLYRVVHGEISPFRLVRMSQKDMQATKAPEPSAEETEVKDASAKATTLLLKPELVKVDLPNLPNPVRADRRPDRRPVSTVASQEQKRSLSAPALKTRANQTSQGRAAPDILTCVLKDTTSEHKAHLFDVKCRICTGQIPAEDEEEPARKKARVSETRDKHEPSWRQSAGDDSPLRAPPDSSDMDSPTSSLMDPASRLVIDSPVLTIVESPASPTMDSPASPILDSPASPVMECPASPTHNAQNPRKPKRAYQPVVIPAVSTVTITRRDPRTAAGRFSAMSVRTSSHSSTPHNQSAPYAPGKKASSALPTAPVSSLPPIKAMPKSILTKPSSSSDPRLYGASSRTLISEPPADGETAQFLAKQEILWKGFLNMVTVAKFVTKGYLVSGCAENLKADLPDTIQIGGRIMPQTVWDYVAKLKTSVTKELCVIRFHPATEEEEVAYISLFSYFSSRGRFGVVANNSNSIKDVYLVPLSAKESIPSILQPLEGPGLEKKRPNLLLGLAVIQKAKQPAISCQEIEAKRPNVHMSKDPMWIPKPPVLYGSDKLEIFQPYDPETPATTSPSGSPTCPGSPSDSSSSGSGTIPSLLTSIRATPPVSTLAGVAATQFISGSVSDKNSITEHSDKTPLQTILKTLFGNKQTDSTDSCDGDSTAAATTTMTVTDKNIPVLSQVSRSMVDPIVQQYGPKSKVKEIQQEENDFDRPYDPEEEYNPVIGYGMVISQNTGKKKRDVHASSGLVDDDVAYDPEDETIFEDIQRDNILKRAHVETSDLPSSPAALSTTHAVASSATSTLAQTSTPVTPMPNFPTGTVVVSAATLTEQQRMLEELNKQIEEQKRQLKEQEEALRQQRETVGMFMAHFSVSDSLMSPPAKSLPLSQLTSQTTDKNSNPTETADKQNVNSQPLKQDDASSISDFQNGTDTITVQDETHDIGNESDKYSSAGEIEDSDVAYDPEDESLFNEIQEDVFQGSSMRTRDSSLSRAGPSSSLKGTSPNSHHSRKRKLSPKRRSHRERDHHRSPSRRSQRRSPSHSRRRRERDRHRRSERDRLRHRTRDQSERRARHRKDHTTRRRSHGHRRSSSSPGKKDSMSISPQKQPSPQVTEKLEHPRVLCEAAVSVGESNSSSATSVSTKNDPDGYLVKCDLVQNPDKDSSPCLNVVQNVKLEISEKDVVTDHNDESRGSFTQVDKPYKVETLLKDKLETPVPLREIDPPLRDSPESPDPDPQFVNPCDLEQSDSIGTEEQRDLESHTSDPLPHVKEENNCLFIGGQAKLPNILWSTVGSSIPDVRNLDFRTLDLKSGNRDQSMIEATTSDIQAFQAEIGSLTKYLGREIKETGTLLPEPVTKCLGITSPVQNVDSASMHTMNPELHDPNTGDSKQAVQGQKAVTVLSNSQLTNINSMSSVTEIGGAQSFFGPQIEGRAPDNRDGCLHRPGIRSSIKGGDVIGLSLGSSFDGSRRALEERSTQKRVSQPHGKSADFCIGEGGTQRGQGIAIRGARPNDDSLTRESGDPKRNFKEPQTDTRAEINVHGSGMHESDDVKVTGSEWKNEPMEQDYRRPVQSIHKIDWSIPGRVIPNMGFQRNQSPQLDPHMRNLELSGPRLGTGHDWREMDRRGSGSVKGRAYLQNEWRVHQPHRRESNMESLGHKRGPVCPEYIAPEGEKTEPNINVPVHDIGETEGPNIGRHGPGGPEFRGPQSERRGPTMYGPGINRRGPEPESRLLSIEGPVLDMGHSGAPDFRGPRLERRSSSMECPGIDKRGITGPNVWGQGPENDFLFVEGPGVDSHGFGASGFSGPGPEMRSLSTGADSRQPEGPDITGQEPGRRGSSMGGLGHDRRELGAPDFRRQRRERRGRSMDNEVTDNRGPGGCDFQEPEHENRGLANNRPGNFEGRGPNRIRPGDQNSGVLGPNRRGSYIGDPGPGRSCPQIEGPRPYNRGREGLCFRGPGPESGHKHIGPDGRGLDISGPPWLEGPGLEGLRPNRRGLKRSNFRRPGTDRGPPDMEGTKHNSSFPGDPQFGSPEQERTLSEGGPEPDRKISHFRPVEPESAILGQGKGPDFRCPNTLGFEPRSERRGPYIEPDWRRSGSSDFIDPDIRQKGQTIDGSIHDRGDEWGGSNFRVSESMQGTPDMEGSGLERTGQRLRGPRSMRRKMRGRGKDMRSLNQIDRLKGTDTVDQWSDRRGPDMEINETENSGDNWKRHANRGLAEHGQDYSRQGPHGDWRGPGFRGPIIDPLDDWGGPDWRDIGPHHDMIYDVDMVYPGTSRRGPGNEWEEPDRGVSGPGRRESEPFIRGERDSDNIEYDRIRSGTRGLDIGNHFRENIKRPGNHRGGPDMISSEREFELEGVTEVFSHSDLRHLGPENRNANIKDPWTDGSFLDYDGLGSERMIGMEGHGSGRQGFEQNFRRERRGPDLRRPGGGLDKISDLCNWPSGWDTNIDISQFATRGPTMVSPDIDSRGSEQPMSDMQASDIRVPGYAIRDPDIRHREPGQRVHTNTNQRRTPALRDFSNPHQVVRFHSLNHQHSTPFNKPPTPHSGGKPFPSFDNPQNQHAVKPQKKRAALLPTPTEGLVRFPNCPNNNPDVYSLNQKQLGHSTEKDWSRSRSVSRERDLVRGQRQEQERSPEGKKSTRGGDEEK